MVRLAVAERPTTTRSRSANRPGLLADERSEQESIYTPYACCIFDAWSVSKGRHRATQRAVTTPADGWCADTGGSSGTRAAVYIGRSGSILTSRALTISRSGQGRPCTCGIGDAEGQLPGRGRRDTACDANCSYMVSYMRAAATASQGEPQVEAADHSDGRSHNPSVAGSSPARPVSGSMTLVKLDDCPTECETGHGRGLSVTFIRPPAAPWRCSSG
jgi:hypothetical protein